MVARPGKNTAAAAAVVIVTAPLTMAILTLIGVFQIRIVVMALDHGGGMDRGVVEWVQSHRKIHIT
jgi:hypothetical protein